MRAGAPRGPTKARSNEKRMDLSFPFVSWALAVLKLGIGRLETTSVHYGKRSPRDKRAGCWACSASAPTDLVANCVAADGLEPITPVCGTVRVPIPQHTRQTRSRSRQPPSERYAEQAEVDEHSELGLVPPRHTAYPAGDDPRAFGFAGGTRGGERNSQTCGAQPQHRVSTGEHQRICASFRFTAD